jgi:tetratricopeptide (TPR) repeat protein
MGRALALADGLEDGLTTRPARAEALVRRAQLEDEDVEAGEALLVRALEDAGGDELLRGRVLDQLGWLRGVFRGDLSAGIACARQALAVAESLGDREFEMSAAAGLSNMETLAGTPRPDLMARAVEIEGEIGRPALWVGPRVLLAEQLLWAGDLPGARALLEVAEAEAARSSNERWGPYGLYDLAAVESAAGNLAEADAFLGRAIEAARDSEDAHVESWIFYRLALVATWLGRAGDAREAAGRRLDVAGRRGERPGIARARSVLGLLALSEGDAGAAARELAEAARLLAEMGFAHPGAVPALPDGIEALAWQARSRQPARSSGGSSGRPGRSGAPDRSPPPSEAAGSWRSRAALLVGPRGSGGSASCPMPPGPSSSSAAHSSGPAGGRRRPRRSRPRSSASRRWARCSGRRAPPRSSSASRRVGSPES